MRSMLAGLEPSVFAEGIVNCSLISAPRRSAVRSGGGVGSFRSGGSGGPFLPHATDEPITTHNADTAMTAARVILGAPGGFCVDRRDRTTLTEYTATSRRS